MRVQYSPLWRYALALLLPTAALAVKLLLGGLLIDTAPALLQVTSVMVVAIVAGFLPGVMATAVNVIGYVALFGQSKPSGAVALQAAFFAGEGLLICWLCTSRSRFEQRAESEHRNAQEAERRERDLARSNAELAEAVAGAQARKEWLERSNAALERSNRDLEIYASVASHDLQEPLRKIDSFAGLIALRYRDALGADGLGYLKRMEDAANRMQRLIDDLLMLARVSATSVELRPVDLGEIATQVAGDLEIQIIESGARLEIGALPTVPAEPTQMRQLLTNLVANALKFRRSDTPPAIRIASIPARTPGLCSLEVADNGIGIPPEHLDGIFEPFRRLHPRGSFAGSGIGLAICRRIVELHGGTIVARSTPGSGSSFIVSLPLISRAQSNA